MSTDQITPAHKRGFFIRYAGVDKTIAEWFAGVIEEGKYSAIYSRPEWENLLQAE